MAACSAISHHLHQRFTALRWRATVSCRFYTRKFKFPIFCTKMQNFNIPLCSVRLKFILLEMEGYIRVNHDNSFFLFHLRGHKEAILCKMLEIIICIGLHGLCVRHVLTCYNINHVCSDISIM